MVAGQRITVGFGHAGETVTVTADGDRFQVHNDERFLIEVARTTTKSIARFKARKPELPRLRQHGHTVTSPAGLPSTTVTGTTDGPASAPAAKA